VTSGPAPAPLADPPAAAALAAALRRAGFDATALNEVFADGDERPAAELEARAARLPPALATVVRLFVLGRPAARTDAESALGEGLAAAVALRALQEDDGVRPTLRIVPHDVLYLASDLPTPEPPDEHVAAAHAPSLTLARLTVRGHVARSLDLGTGNGIQALLLAQHSDRVVATDLSERALRFTELNAALNGRTNVETRRGSWFEPVEGERFGAVVCSPPYVVSPGSRILYRDGDVRGDALSERLVRDIPRYLEEGAFATVLVSWVPTAGDIEPLPVGWAADSGCDGLVLCLHRESAQTAGAAWYEGDQLAAALEFYRREGIDEIAYGAVVLHRRAGGSWQDSLELPGGPAGHAGAHLQRIFAAREWLGRGAILERRLALAPDASLRGTELSLRGGLGLGAELDEAGAVVVAQLSQAPSVRAAFDAAARELQEDPDTIRELGAPLVSRLVELGFVVPA
jgi:methylase of polypeptide subunit release factors